MAAASAAMSLVILAVKKFLMVSPVVLLIVCIALGGLVYFACMAAMGMAPVRKSGCEKRVGD
jgi:hypothetical protein